MPPETMGLLSAIRAVSFSGSLVSTVALVVAVFGVRWTWVGLLALAALLALAVLHAVASALGRSGAERFAPKAAIVLGGLATVMRPLLSTRWPLAGLEPLEGDASLDRTSNGAAPELDLDIQAHGEPLDEREVRMIRGVVELDQTVAREIMVPRVDMVAAEVDVSIHELAEQMITGGHSRIPVYRGDLDRIEGIAYARDLLARLVHREDTSGLRVEDVIRPPLFIPESKTLEELLTEFQRRRVHMAIVVDEYGGVSGLVTIEDLLEEIVGEIRDEFEVGEPEIVPVTEGEFLMDARVSLDQLNDLLRVSVEGDGFDTLGGFVYQRLGRIPSTGDTVDYDGLRIEVVSTSGRRLKRLRVTSSAPPDASSSTAAS